MELALRAIVEPRRREILRLVQDTELSAGEIAQQFDVTRPAISQHLRVLTDAGLLAMRQKGTRRVYRARPEGLEEIRRFLDQFWEEQLQLLKQEAEAEERSSRNGGN